MGKQYLYHVTPLKNVESILRDGLKRKGFAVYLSEDPFNWWTPGMAILKVRVSGIKAEMTTFLPELDEVLVWGDISKYQITRWTPPRRKLQQAKEHFEAMYVTDINVGNKTEQEGLK